MHIKGSHKRNKDASPSQKITENVYLIEIRQNQHQIGI